jgi:hypothetical protein
MRFVRKRAKAPDWRSVKTGFDGRRTADKKEDGS